MHALAQQMETHKSVTGELVENIQAYAVHKASSDVKGIVVNASHVIDEGINTSSDGHEEEEESDVNIIEIIDNEKQDLDESVMNAVNTNIIELLKQAFSSGDSTLKSCSLSEFSDVSSGEFAEVHS